MIRTIFLVVLALELAACSEPDQSLAASSAKVDGKAWQGAQNAFVAPGWQPGDKERWEQQLRQRAQTQNEYLRIQ